jgi:hypothetical protein
MSISRTCTIDTPSVEDIEVYRGSYKQFDFTCEDTAGSAVDLTDARIILTVYDIEGATNEFQLKRQAVTDASWATDVVTFTAASHGFSVGDSVTVGDCGESNYDGTYTVASVPTDNTFTAALVGDPGAWTTNGQVNTDEIEVTTAASGLFSVYLTDDETDTDEKTYTYSLWVQLTGGTEHHVAVGKFFILYSVYDGS